jgi:hypothetical protein
MDNKVYFIILNALKEYNNSLTENYGTAIYSLPPKLNKDQELKFPIVRFYQVGDTQNPSFNSPFDRVSSKRFVIDIFAKDKGKKILRNEIALDLAEKFNAFLSYNCGLLRVSYNEFDLEAEGSIYRISMTYSGNLHENRRKFI